jgi:plasmid stabilization system protein ParE
VTSVIFLVEARAEALDIFRWYEEQRTGLGIVFGDALDTAIGRVRELPLAHPVVYRDLRRALVDRFPYALYYRAQSDAIVVVAVVHGRRHPNRWRQRT